MVADRDASVASAWDVLAAMTAGCEAAAGSGRPESVLREHVQPALVAALESRGVRSAGRDEVPLQVPTEAEADLLDAPLETAGRADAIYNRFVIEFEPPGSLRPALWHRATMHAVRQVQQYLRGLAQESGLPLERLAGCAVDGSLITYVTWDHGDWQITTPQEIDESTVGALVEALASLATGRGLTAENLDEDFGRDSELAREVVASFAAIFLNGTESPRTLAMLEQWRMDVGNASGPFSSSDLAEWRSLCEDLGVPGDEQWSRQVLFCLQTYFALVAKLAAVIILEGATGEALVDRLASAETTLEGLEEMESGRLTLPANAANVIEPGIFSWYLGEPTPELMQAVERMVATASEYSAEVVEITPTAARDVLKDLYQRLLPTSIRHRLGEYYTPDWLARHVLDAAAPEGISPQIRVLDPACGSGTFLVEVIARMLARSEDDDPAVVIEQILKNVVGVDLSPLAVQSSKVNYVLALAPLLRHAPEPIQLPIYLADSVSPPRRGDLLQGDVYVLSTSEGDWRLPASINNVRDLAALFSRFETGLREGVPPDVATEMAREALGDPSVSEDDLLATRELYAKVRELDEVGRDGMWLHLLGNAFAPMFEEPFDLVVGNPPWVSWETLPEQYRRSNEDLWDLYQLRPTTNGRRRQASSNARLDLAMLFVARCIDYFLRDNGRLGFVITATPFHSEIAGRGFRGRHLPNGSRYRFALIEDLRGLQVFDEAANQAAVLVAEKAPPETHEVPITRWFPGERSTVDPTMSLDDVLTAFPRLNMAGEPVDPRDPASPLLAMPPDALIASRTARRASPYLDAIREGINTRGANGIFFVEILGEEDGLTRVRNNPALGRTRGVPQVTGLVEPGAVRQLLRGEDVSSNSAEPSLGVMFFHDSDHLSQPIPAGEARRRFPEAFGFMQNFEEILRARRTFRNFDPSGDQWLGLYSVTRAAVALHKVVIREIAQGLVTAPVATDRIIPDHKLYVIPCESESEAVRLSAVLSSPVTDYLVRSFSLSTSLTGSFLRYVGIKKLSEVPETGSREGDAAAALGLTRDEYALLKSASENPQLA